MKKIKRFINGFVYFHIYDENYANKLMVIGFLRRWYKFKYFFYYPLNK